LRHDADSRPIGLQGPQQLLVGSVALHCQRGETRGFFDLPLIEVDGGHFVAEIVQRTGHGTPEPAQANNDDTILTEVTGFWHVLLS
jgi:hypothetical protein